MGRPERGFSAHRAGFVTRAVTIALLRSKGTALSDEVLNAIVRAGGWQAVTGAMTVMRVYARNILDEMLDTYALTFGVEASDEEWADRKRQYLEVRILAERSITRRDAVPLGRIRTALRLPVAQALQRAVNVTGAAVMGAALGHGEVMPVRRYREDGDAFRIFQGRNRKDTQVLLYEAFWSAFQKVMKNGAVGGEG
jgi:hypothetical protein